MTTPPTPRLGLAFLATGGYHRYLPYAPHHHPDHRPSEVPAEIVGYDTAILVWQVSEIDLDLYAERGLRHIPVTDARRVFGADSDYRIQRGPDWTNAYADADAGRRALMKESARFRADRHAATIPTHRGYWIDLNSEHYVPIAEMRRAVLAEAEWISRANLAELAEAHGETEAAVREALIAYARGLDLAIDVDLNHDVLPPRINLTPRTYEQQIVAAAGFEAYPPGAVFVTASSPEAGVAWSWTADVVKLAIEDDVVVHRVERVQGAAAPNGVALAPGGTLTITATDAQDNVSERTYANPNPAPAPQGGADPSDAPDGAGDTAQDDGEEVS